jgi:hypothetical protein
LWRSISIPRRASASSPLFETVYDEDGVTVWRLAGS